MKDKEFQKMKLGDIVKITNSDGSFDYGAVCYVYPDGGFSAISRTGFWALAERTEWEPTGRTVDFGPIYEALRQMDGGGQ